MSTSITLKFWMSGVSSKNLPTSLLVHGTSWNRLAHLRAAWRSIQHSQAPPRPSDRWISTSGGSPPLQGVGQSTWGAEPIAPGAASGPPACRASWNHPPGTAEKAAQEVWKNIETIRRCSTCLSMLTGGRSKTCIVLQYMILSKALGLWGFVYVYIYDIYVDVFFVYRCVFWFGGHKTPKVVYMDPHISSSLNVSMLSRIA